MSMVMLYSEQLGKDLFEDQKYIFSRKLYWEGFISTVRPDKIAVPRQNLNVNAFFLVSFIFAQRKEVNVDMFYLFFKVRKP